MAAADHRIVLDVVQISVSVNLFQTFINPDYKIHVVLKNKIMYANFSEQRIYMMESSLKVGKYRLVI